MPNVGQSPAMGSPPDTRTQDVELLSAVCHGDRAAAAELYDRHAGAVYSLALRITRSPAQAEDVVQDAFVTLWTKARQYDSERASVAGWLLAIARNGAIDRLRSNSHEDGPLPDELPDRSEQGEVGDSLLASERAHGVRTALAKVPPRQREVIELMYFEGLAQHQIATKLGVPLGTVKSRAYHGLLRLRDLLAHEGVRP